MRSTNIVKNIAFWLVILLSAVLLWKVVRAGGSNAKESEIAFSRFMQDVESGAVNKVTISGADIHGNYKSGNAAFHTFAPPRYSGMIDQMREKGVEIIVKDNSGNGWPTLLNLSPLILFAALWFFMIRQTQTRRLRAVASGASWHSAADPPPFSSIQSAGQSWRQSPRLLLANANGNLTLGYCRSQNGENTFYPDAQIGPVVAWMIAPVLPAEPLK